MLKNCTRMSPLWSFIFCACIPGHISILRICFVSLSSEQPFSWFVFHQRLFFVFGFGKLILLICTLGCWDFLRPATICLLCGSNLASFKVSCHSEQFWDADKKFSPQLDLWEKMHFLVVRSWNTFQCLGTMGAHMLTNFTRSILVCKSDINVLFSKKCLLSALSDLCFWLVFTAEWIWQNVQWNRRQCVQRTRRMSIGAASLDGRVRTPEVKAKNKLWHTKGVVALRPHSANLPDAVGWVCVKHFQFSKTSMSQKMSHTKNRSFCPYQHLKSSNNHKQTQKAWKVPTTKETHPKDDASPSCHMSLGRNRLTQESTANPSLAQQPTDLWIHCFSWIYFDTENWRIPKPYQLVFAKHGNRKTICQDLNSRR